MSTPKCAQGPFRPLIDFPAMLIGRDTRRVPIPHEPEEWIEARQALPPYVLERASEAWLIGQMRMLSVLGEQGKADLVRQGEKSADKPDARRMTDLDVLSAHLVTAWSYSETPTLDTIRMLDARTRDWLHELAWEAARPPTDEETEGNSSRSIDPYGSAGRFPARSSSSESSSG